jgi:hypothetical protein
MLVARRRSHHGGKRHPDQADAASRWVGPSGQYGVPNPTDALIDSPLRLREHLLYSFKPCNAGGAAHRSPTPPADRQRATTVTGTSRGR